MKTLLKTTILAASLLAAVVGYSYSDNGFTGKWLDGNKSDPQIIIKLSKGDKAKTFSCFWVQKKGDSAYFFTTTNGWWGWNRKIMNKNRAYPTSVRIITFHSKNYVALKGNEQAAVHIQGCNVFCKYEDEP